MSDEMDPSDIPIEVEVAAEIVRSCLDSEGGDLYIGHLGDPHAVELITKIAEAIQRKANEAQPIQQC